MSSEPKKSYAQVTTFEKVAAIGHAILLPSVLIWSLFTKQFYPESRAKSLIRYINDVSLNYLAKLKPAKLQFVLGTTDKVYRKWAQNSNVPVVEEELGENAKLFWLGPKRPNRVILYLHGGAFFFPATEQSFSFWKYVQEQLTGKDREMGVAILQYTLVPDATFPVQLKQAILALQHLLSIGISPRNIQLGGDSAGGNLILQLISHALHPVEAVPVLKLDAPLRGAYLMSPWVQLDGNEKFASFKIVHDILSPPTAISWGKELLASGIPDEYTPYVQPLKAPEHWFQGVDKIVERLLITTGDLDLLRDQGIEFKAFIEKHHSDVRITVQPNGVHDGPFFDFLTRKPDVTRLTLDIIEWYASGC